MKLEASILSSWSLGMEYSELEKKIKKIFYKRLDYSEKRNSCYYIELSMQYSLFGLEVKCPVILGDSLPAGKK